MTTYHLQEIAPVLNGQLTKNSGGKINYLLIDSRKVLFPRESLFFALRGLHNDGHYYLSELYQQGVRNFVVETLPENLEMMQRANFIQVSNTLKALQNLVRWHRSHISVPVLGITGSNGKTIVKEWIYQCLHNEKYIIRNPKSYNSQIGVPLSVWLLNAEAGLGIFEAGISQAGEMEHLQAIIQPEIGIFTNIGDAHQENFTSREQKIREKLKLFTACHTLIYCADQPLVNETIRAEINPATKKFTWGSSPDCQLSISGLETLKSGALIEASYQGEAQSVKIPFFDKASIENAIHVWSFLLVQGYPLSFIQEKLSRLEHVAMRLELKEGTNNCTLINDSYNSDLESLHIAMDFLSQQNQHPQKVLILSDIEQSGFKKDELYQQVAGMLQQKNIDRLIGIGPDIHAHQHLFELRKDFYLSTREFIESNEWLKFQHLAILLKGARRFEFENLSKLLQKQNHRTVFEIDLNALLHNLNYFKNLLKPTTGIVAMLKASGYGSGTYEIANLCQYQRVAAIAVAFPDEGIELRKAGIKTPIWVMNPEEESFATMINHRLEPQLSNFSSIHRFNIIAESSDSKPYPVHIKLDTGMHRSGFMADELDLLIRSLKDSENLKVVSIFSHLASADEPQQDDFTHEQVVTFEKMSQTLMEQFPYKIKRHILNSAGIERFPKYQYDMVRLGIGLFGISATDAPLAQVGTLNSSIIQLKKLKKGQTVGYSRKGVLDKDSIIATVPVGYADGLRRILSNGVGKIWVNGKMAPIVGNICMDMCMIDVTGISVQEGDCVEILGKNLSINELAHWMQTIPYEVLTGISKRVKRTYHLE
ncbi:MAG: bifunctional UDP-N-acetylmuramoyl-tripeptide:D-alanyl-D-alanine ligase/alanine racemase [Bacteroidetes bacterium HGW-Bacteroidetes-4]|jgi:alanine racemase|nr:MAG: bifunctional UDP-N-acetylmuramoyl-tripeptide:D-alanyl-D-alanine ligase/alanine racemase [Bacteroidetes bacterium HGW-Bacteroidetes-4]